ncbi:MAG TPA: DUF1588 domain-containing protein, partial [Polyangia bacterium]|nr:DUF1588 domain-containing protein [Polyangia bacterium]
MQRDCEMATRVLVVSAGGGTRLYLLCSLLALGGACQGTIGDSAGTETGPGTGGGGNGAGPPRQTGPDAHPTACMGRPPEASVLHARMLSPRQYNNTVADLLKVGGNPASAFGGGADTQLDDLGAERRANAAASIAHQAAAQLAMWSPCAATVADCKQQIINKIGTNAFRHPLSPVERQQLTALFDAGVKEKDFLTGVEWFLTGVLQSPDFLYQLVRPAPNEKAGTIQTIYGYEMASRLSYFVWDSMPDEKLFAAAAAGLGDLNSIQQQLGRMVADERFLHGVGSFYSHWLAIESFQELARDDKAFTTDVVGALGTSLLMSATQLYSTPDPNIASLFSGSSYYLNGTLRAFYGKGSGAADFVATDMPGENRYGILTHPALMAELARPQKTHPINRGLFFRTKLLCQELTPPGGDIPPLPEAPVMGVTTREEVAEHSKNPMCASCHALLDPPGFALEGFDQLGRSRDSENGKPVDTSGTMLNAGDLEGPFTTGEELLSKLADSRTVRGCFAQQYFQFA